MRWAIVAILALLGAGCTGRVYTLEPRWAPLAEIREVSDRLIKGDRLTTVCPWVLTGDLGLFLRDYPPESVEFEAVMRHEHVHAIREVFFGDAFYPMYAVSDRFRWQEERLGYHAEIRYLVRHGRTVDPSRWATWLSKGYSDMIGFEAAFAWVNSEVAVANVGTED